MTAMLRAALFAALTAAPVPAAAAGQNTADSRRRHEAASRAAA